MNAGKFFWRTVLATVLALVITTVPIFASGDNTVNVISPRYNNIGGYSFGIDFDENNVVTVSLSLSTYSHCSGVSGLVKLFDSSGTCLTAWSVSDYEKPISFSATYQGVRGETYTATFGGYAYSNNGTAPDRLDLTYTDTCDGN